MVVLCFGPLAFCVFRYLLSALDNISTLLKSISLSMITGTSFDFWNYLSVQKSALVDKPSRSRWDKILTPGRQVPCFV